MPKRKRSVEMTAIGLPTLAPHVKIFFQKVVQDGRVGICSGSISITNPQSGSPHTGNLELMDRAKLVIPYGGQTITWEVIFQYDRPECPPDFIFDDPEFEPDITDIKSLCDWDPDQPEALLDVVKELLDHYRANQVALLESSARLQLEYGMLLEQSEITEKDIEIATLKMRNRGGQINFLIRLPVDFSQLYPIYEKDKINSLDSAVLLISFHPPEAARITSQLFLSPKIEQVLNMLDGGPVRIPTFPRDSCLMDYVPLIKESLQQKVEQMATGYHGRREYILAFLSLFGRSLLEFDSCYFLSISFLLEWNEYFFVLQIDLSLNFPVEKPRLVLVAIYTSSQTRQTKKVFMDYPYSPRWSGQEMAQRAKDFVLQEIEKFKDAHS